MTPTLREIFDKLTIDRRSGRYDGSRMIREDKVGVELDESVGLLNLRDMINLFP